MISNPRVLGWIAWLFLFFFISAQIALHVAAFDWWSAHGAGVVARARELAARLRPRPSRAAAPTPAPLNMTYITMTSPWIICEDSSDPTHTRTRQTGFITAWITATSTIRCYQELSP